MDGTFIPNTEFGHLEIDGQDAEVTTSAVARERNAMGWADYALHLNRYLSHLEFLLTPDLIIIGGGISARSASFSPSKIENKSNFRKIAKYCRNHRGSNPQIGRAHV